MFEESYLIPSVFLFEHFLSFTSSADSVKHLQTLMSWSELSFCDLCCRLTCSFVRCPMQGWILFWAVREVLKCVVSSPCLPAAWKEIIEVFCHNVASCVWLRNHWLVTNRQHQQHCEAEELVKNEQNRCNPTWDVNGGEQEKKIEWMLLFFSKFSAESSAKGLVYRFWS